MTGKDHTKSIVSRETFSRLEIYASLLEKWNPKINLIAKSTINTLWDRHILDSIQFFNLIEEKHKNWLDIGSGGGFPGLVLAILAMDMDHRPKISMIESDQRKSVFLRTVLRETGAEASVTTSRIENLPSYKADILTARALADLPNLLNFADRHLSKTGTALFAKGANWKKELSDAQLAWQFTWEAVKSKTAPDAVILKIQGITHV